jgi:hypothetical protein
MMTARKRTKRASGGRLGRILFALLASALLSLALGPGCAERENPEDPQIGGHPEAFSDAASVDFHGTRVRARGPEACQACHGEDLAGGSGFPGCYDCHAGPGGHPRNWALASAPRFHGDVVAQKGPGACADCHGEALDGGWSGVSCDDCHAGAGGHPDGWMNPDALSFHGRLAFVDGVQGCARCHGYPPARGTSGVSCADCHN